MGKKTWTLNPRGKLWSEDDNKFGQKLMEKMGWSKGKGLGANEDGNPDVIRVSYKNDNKGLGFKGRDDAWIDHQDDFNALLSSLNNEDKPDTTLAKISLEERSKKSKKRVHYHKFTRGKDVSKYSSEDLSCILGKRQRASSENPMIESVEKNEDTLESATSEFGVKTINTGSSVQDYFSMKMAAKKQKLENLSKIESPVTANRDSNRIIVDNFDGNYVVEDISENKTKKRKQKNKVKDCDVIKDENTELCFSESKNDCANADYDMFSEKKDKKRRKNKSSVEHCQTDHELGIIYSDTNVAIFKGETEEEMSKKKKKKKNNKYELCQLSKAVNGNTLCNDYEVFSENGTAVADDDIQRYNCKKKKKKNKNSSIKEN